jgi:hypothetical protein
MVKSVKKMVTFRCAQGDTGDNGKTDKYAYSRSFCHTVAGTERVGVLIGSFRHAQRNALSVHVQS